MAITESAHIHLFDYRGMVVNGLIAHSLTEEAALDQTPGVILDLSELAIGQLVELNTDPDN